MARGRNLDGEPEKVLARALELEPQNLKALALAGTAAFNRHDYGTAQKHWQKMLRLVPADSEEARSIQASVHQAKAMAAQRPFAFALDDSVAMAPAMTLSGQPRVIVGARVSKSGDPAPKPGDLQGASAPVANDAQGVNVVIDTVVP